MGGRLVVFSYTNKTDRHDITEILLRVALNTITLFLHCVVVTTEKTPRVVQINFNEMIMMMSGL
jgi:hypothetical protein